jgi:hypothetical protein
MTKIRKFAGFIVAAAVFTSISLHTYAQSYYVENQNTFFGGPVVGANFTQVDGDNYAGYHKAGLNVGGIVFMRLDEMFAASMEILYSQRGSRSNGVKISNFQTYQIQKYGLDLDYAEVPIMIHIFDKRRSHASIGLSYAQLVSSKETVTTNNKVFDDSVDFTRYPFKKADLNFIVGGDIRLYKGLYLGIRFQYSLLSVRKTFYNEFGRADQFNNSYVVRLSYIFGDKYPRRESRQ